MSQETRWAEVRRSCQAHNVQSMLGYRLFTGGRNLGALDLHSSKRNAFDADSDVFRELFAAHAAIALSGPTRQTEWRRALSSRDAIGMTTGILNRARTHH